MYSVGRLMAQVCRLMAGLVVCGAGLQLNSVISTEPESAGHMRRLMQYDDLPPTEPQLFPVDGLPPLQPLADEPAGNQSLFRAPALQEPILEPIADPAQRPSAAANFSRSGAPPEVGLNTSSPPTALGSAEPAQPAAPPVPPLSSTGENAQQKLAASNKRPQSAHLNDTNSAAPPTRLAAPTAELFAGEPPAAHLQHLLRYLVNAAPPHQASVPRSRLVPPTATVYRQRVAPLRPRLAQRRPREKYSEPPLPPPSLASRLWSLFGGGYPSQPTAPEVTRFQWVYPPHAPKKRRRNQLPPPLAVSRTRRKVVPGTVLGSPQPRPLVSAQHSLAQSASHLNSYTLEPAVEGDLVADEFLPMHDQEPSSAFHLSAAQQEAAAGEFSAHELPVTAAGFGAAEPSEEFPVTLPVADLSATNQALLLSHLLKAQEQQQQQVPKKRRKQPKTPQQLSYLNQLASSSSQESPSEPQASTSTTDEPTDAGAGANPDDQQTAAAQDEPAPSRKANRHQQQVQDEQADLQQAEQQRPPNGAATGRRKLPPSSGHQQAAPRQKRARHPTRALRSNRNLQNFYDYGPAGGDLQPSSTFLRWKYPQMYDENEEDGETELNIRFFNNFSRVGPLTGLARNAATATLIISLVLLIISNICMASTYLVHGLSALSTFYAPPSATTSLSPASSMARPKNVTSLSYTSWDSLLPPFMRDRSSRSGPVSTSTTLAPYLNSRSFLSAHNQHQPSMTFDSEIKALGDPWK